MIYSFLFFQSIRKIKARWIPAELWWVIVIQVENVFFLYFFLLNKENYLLAIKNPNSTHKVNSIWPCSSIKLTIIYYLDVMRKYSDFKYIMPLLKNVTERGLKPRVFNKVPSNIKCYVTALSFNFYPCCE